MFKEIYFAGGCFWGVEEYFALMEGVKETKVGYANGATENPSYKDVCQNNTGHAEAVKVIYDCRKLSLSFLLEMFYQIIDPVSVNRQGNDHGVQYRTGIYYVDSEDFEVIEHSLKNLQKNYQEPIAVELKPLKHFYDAEDYHQKYLQNNPGGYCHIGIEHFEKARNVHPNVSQQKTKEQLKELLTPLQYQVTMENGTEPPFQNEYYDRFEEGVYVDITTGEPLFFSKDKFESGCGWPSFAKPIDGSYIKEKIDSSHGMVRTEVRSKAGDAHLGHVFDDGPRRLGGLRYCINSASLRFIPKDEMEQQGYGEYLTLMDL